MRFSNSMTCAETQKTVCDQVLRRDTASRFCCCCSAARVISLPNASFVSSLALATRADSRYLVQRCVFHVGAIGSLLSSCGLILPQTLGRAAGRLGRLVACN